jgi:hypothetical protein
LLESPKPTIDSSIAKVGEPFGISRVDPEPKYLEPFGIISKVDPDPKFIESQSIVYILFVRVSKANNLLFHS